MTPPSDNLPDDLESLKRLLAAERSARIDAEKKASSAEAAAARAAADVSNAEALIAHLKLAIEKMRRELFGSRSERSRKLLDQMELELEELEAIATEDEIAAEIAATKADAATSVSTHIRRKPARKPFPPHLPRERVIVRGPTACICCGSMRLSKFGEDVTETLEVIPRQWKVIQHVREKFSQAPAPFHVIPRGWAGPSLLAMVAFEKFGQHQPLNRQAERRPGRRAP